MPSPGKSPVTLLIAAGVSLLLLAGCAGEGRYEDPSAPTPVSEFFSDTDFKLLARGVAAELGECLAGRRGAVVLFLPFRNRTADRIDMSALAGSVAAELTRMGFRVADAGLREYVRKEGAGKELERARLAGADVLVTGRLSSVAVRPARNRKVVYYLLTVEATDTETGITICSVEREMKKALRRTPVAP